MLDVSPGFSAIILGGSLFLVATELEKSPHRSLSEFAFLIALCWLNAGIFDRVAIASAPNWAVLLTGMSIISAAYGLEKGRRQDRLAGLGMLIGSAMAYTGLFDLVYKTAVEPAFFAVTASMLYACILLDGDRHAELHRLFHHPAFRRFTGLADLAGPDGCCLHGRQRAGHAGETTDVKLRRAGL